MAAAPAVDVRADVAASGPVGVAARGLSVAAAAGGRRG